MKSTAATVTEYTAALPSDRQGPVQALVDTINQHIPEGFQMCMQYGMISRVVPHALYPAGYHCTPEQPLPFLALASQKNSINIYHMGIYADLDLLNRFTQQRPLYTSRKLDMGKSCVRCTRMDVIPYTLFGELAARMTTAERIALYERELKK